ncbi:MAG: cytochrome c [Aquincola sp.]|nr:cytochrome c [Aquincola sp.]
MVQMILGVREAIAADAADALAAVRIDALPAAGQLLLDAVPVIAGQVVTRADLDRGQERFNIYCAPCHSQTGDGNGMVVQRGYRQAASLHIDRLRAMPLGYFVDVITNGFGAMPTA